MKSFIPIFIGFFIVLFFIVSPRAAFAKETFILNGRIYTDTDFLFPSECITNGSLCENMRFADNQYNSYVNTLDKYITVKLPDFGIPDDASLEYIYVAFRARSTITSTLWILRISNNSGVSYLPFSNSCPCFDFLGTSFNDAAIIWRDTDNNLTVSGKDINAGKLHLKLVQDPPILTSDDADRLIIKILYSLPYVPTPTATPTPTSVPGPAPFLDLPWDYQGKGLSFNEAALALNSYFDHEYPLLSSGLSEPENSSGTIINFLGPPRVDKQYSRHDGYDYGNPAKVHIDDPVLAAAEGIATYTHACGDCGNMILIDHGNGYQTRYLHLQKDGLITTATNEAVLVTAGQQIGRVGATGNVKPKGSSGAHIHFGVFEDKNHDGNFDDNIPDGVTDPFGWQSKKPDPWENYSFFYNGQQRKGNKSFYLWRKKISNLNASLTANGGLFENERYSLNFPKNATIQTLLLSIASSPVVDASASLSSIGSTLTVSAKDILGNFITQFLNSFILKVDFSQFDLSRYKTNTLSIYSSSDGVNWTKEPTTLDFVTKSASAQLNHLTHFALMAERVDTIAPTTTAVLQGQQGEPNWYRSDVQVSLQAVDNEGGLGVDYTMLKKDGGDVEVYTSPLQFTNEGHHKVEFYSADKDGNIETTKSIEFDIDKTVPEAKIFIDQDLQDLVVDGIDVNIHSIQKANSEETKGNIDTFYILEDKAGNTLRLDVRDRDEIKEDSFRLSALQYNQNPPFILQDNHYDVSYQEDKSKLTLHEQRFEIQNEIEIRIQYDDEKDLSTIQIKESDKERVENVKSGIVILQIQTENGMLKYSY